MFYVEQFGVVAQWLEQGAHNALVLGSNPSSPNCCLVNNILRVEYYLKNDT